MPAWSGGSRNELKAELLGLALQVLERAFADLFFVLLCAQVLVFGVVLEHGVDDAGEFVRRGGDALGFAQLGLHVAAVAAQGTLANLVLLTRCKPLWARSGSSQPPLASVAATRRRKRSPPFGVGPPLLLPFGPCVRQASRSRVCTQRLSANTALANRARSVAGGEPPDMFCLYTRRSYV